MKILIILLFPAVTFLSCNNSPDPVSVKKETPVAEKKSFFPVTACIKGEIFELKQSGINPLKYTTIGDHTDSVWLKHDDIDSAVKEFLEPLIDSANLVPLFTEKSFMDQSINAVTFTYDPSVTLPDSMTLRHWDVYINPQSGKVNRIYMVKEAGNGKTLQLTWLCGQWCKLVSIATDQNGTSVVEKEEKITWDF